MTEIERLLILIKSGIDTYESILKFYKNTEDILKELEKLNIQNKTEIIFSIKDLIESLPAKDPKHLESILQNSGAKKIFKDGEAHFRLIDVLLCLATIAQVFLRSK
jgi:hypothetical protein